MLLGVTLGVRFSTPTRDGGGARALQGDLRRVGLRKDPRRGLQRREGGLRAPPRSQGSPARGREGQGDQGAVGVMGTDKGWAAKAGGGRIPWWPGHRNKHSGGHWKDEPRAEPTGVGHREKPDDPKARRAFPCLRQSNRFIAGRAFLVTQPGLGPGGAVPCDKPPRPPRGGDRGQPQFPPTSVRCRLAFQRHRPPGYDTVPCAFR